MSKLEWERLLSERRPKKLGGGDELLGTGIGRAEYERDYDRILFLAPTRRLADKTQVFPMEVNDSVRNRLTHSHEVSNLARSIGVRLVYEHRDTVFRNSFADVPLERIVPPILAATGLAHDLGNPPFGHQGEKAIGQWFAEGDFSEAVHEDFLNFDGNRQTFRLLTKLQILNDQYGLNLTCATLTSLLKYPSFSNSNPQRFSKWGVFESERNTAEAVWKETGLREGIRHPLAYVMEACDDIAYSVIDAEDTVKKGYASYYDVIEFLEEEPTETIERLLEDLEKIHTKFKAEGLSSSELNDLSMQMFRVTAIAQMIEDSTIAFVDNIDSILNASTESGFELIKYSSSKELCSRLKQFDYRHGFTHKDVLELELKGNNYIKRVMDFLWRGIDGDHDSDPFSKYAYGRISENYLRVYEATEKSLNDKCHLLCDAISGMTERYLIQFHDELSNLQ